MKTKILPYLCERDCHLHRSLACEKTIETKLRNCFRAQGYRSVCIQDVNKFTCQDTYTTITMLHMFPVASVRRPLNAVYTNKFCVTAIKIRHRKIVTKNYLEYRRCLENGYIYPVEIKLVYSLIG